MDNLFAAPESYSEEYLDTVKSRAFIDRYQESLIKKIVNQQLIYPESAIFDKSYSADGIKTGITKSIFLDFKSDFKEHLLNSKLNSITGFESFVRDDICTGCTQFMDNIHIRGNVQVLTDEYRYHSLVNPSVKLVTVGNLIPTMPLIISIPFASIGKVHYLMDQILEECLEKNIDVHVDGAWITAAKNTNIDLSHPAIRSFACSMSKGLGLSAWNRIGVRWTKDIQEDSITVMNDYLQIPAYLVVIGKYFLKHMPPDYLWNTHGKNHYKLCADFKLDSTDSLHMAFRDGETIGLTPLLRWLDQNV